VEIKNLKKTSKSFAGLKKITTFATAFREKAKGIREYVHRHIGLTAYKIRE
jgi:hypothetical protein